MRRVVQIEKSELAADGSLLKRFATGNLESLTPAEGSGIEIMQHLFNYHSENYSANIMSLCIVGNYPLEEMEVMAKEHFGDIENKKVVLKDFKTDPMYDDNVLGHLV